MNKKIQKIINNNVSQSRASIVDLFFYGLLSFVVLGALVIELSKSSPDIITLIVTGSVLCLTSALAISTHKRLRNSAHASKTEGYAYLGNMPIEDLERHISTLAIDNNEAWDQIQKAAIDCQNAKNELDKQYNQTINQLNKERDSNSVKISIAKDILRYRKKHPND